MKLKAKASSSPGESHDTAPSEEKRDEIGVLASSEKAQDLQDSDLSKATEIEEREMKVFPKDKDALADPQADIDKSTHANKEIVRTPARCDPLRTTKGEVAAAGSRKKVATIMAQTFVDVIQLGDRSIITVAWPDIEGIPCLEAFDGQASQPVHLEAEGKPLAFICRGPRNTGNDITIATRLPVDADIDQFKDAMNALLDTAGTVTDIWKLEIVDVGRDTCQWNGHLRILVTLSDPNDGNRPPANAALAASALPGYIKFDLVLYQLQFLYRQSAKGKTNAAVIPSTLDIISKRSATIAVKRDDELANKKIKDAKCKNLTKGAHPSAACPRSKKHKAPSSVTSTQTMPRPAMKGGYSTETWLLFFLVPFCMHLLARRR